MIKGLPTLIVEDQKEVADFLLEAIQERFADLEVVAVCSTVKESISSIRNLKPELILMDIELPDGNAFEILDVFPNSNFEVVFITGHSDFMEKALKYFAFSYLTKPYEIRELNEIINRFLLKREKRFVDYKMKIFKDFALENGTKFLLHTGTEHISIDLKSVIFCKADGNYTTFHLDSGKKLLASYSLKYYEKLLSYKGFQRINRFNLINVIHIKSIYKKEALFLSNGSKIQISARNKNLLSNLINEFNGQ